MEKRVEELFPEGHDGKIDPLTWAQIIEARTLLPSYLLASQGDRMLMGNSVEGRFPFLDHRVIEFGFRAPPEMRMRGLREKHVLKEVAKGMVPPAVIDMTKQPYRAPDATCFLRQDSPDYARELLSPEAIRKKGYFDSDRVRRLVEKCRNSPVLGFKDNMALVGILSTQLLDEMFVRGRRPPQSPTG